MGMEINRLTLLEVVSKSSIEATAVAESGFAVVAVTYSPLWRLDIWGIQFSDQLSEPGRVENQNICQ
jgi:hypothetical protein